MTFRFDPTRNDWPYPDEEDLTPDEREAYRAADMMGLPITAVSRFELDDWRREDESFERETRKIVQRVKAQQAREAANG